MKQKLLYLFLLASVVAFAQVPSYYNNVNLNLSGTALRDELATKIIVTHTNALSYTPGIWEACKATDLDPNNSANVLLIYGYSDSDGNYVTDRTRSVNANGGNMGTDWNREHTFPNSLGNPSLNSSGTSGPPYADAHNLRASDVRMNSNRGNKKFASGSGNAGDSNGGWYPGDEWKGDVARIAMYMYLRYGSQCYPTLVANGNTNTADSNMIDLLLQWNAEDPVSVYEDARNTYHNSNATYAQGNRNPFIDNPAFATQIWGGPQAEDRFGNTGGGTDTQAPSAPASLVASSITQTGVSLNWINSTDNVGVTAYNIYRNGSLFQTTTTNAATITNLSESTTYTFFIRAKDAAGNLSSNSNTVSVTTITGGGGGEASEFFFSEYIEGNSNNKALEIANFTGSNKSLSGYSIRRNTNGGSSWGAAFSLSGSVANGDVFVIANASATSAVTNQADVTTTADAMVFNGNDPVGLFKNGTLIDIIGNFAGGSANFAVNITLRRKASISSPSVTYDANDWDSFAVDTFNGLGDHSINGGGTGGSNPTTTVLQESFFETGLDNWIDGGSDCARYSGSRSFEGNYSIRLRDNSGTASSLTSQAFNLTNYDTVEVEFYFYGYSMENGEDFWLQFNNGSGYTTVETFASGTDFNNNTFYSATVTLTNATSNFGISSRFRFRCDASSNADQIYIDQVKITGISNSGSRSQVLDSKESVIKRVGSLVEKDKNEMIAFYPVPVATSLTIQYGNDEEASFEVFNMYGQQVEKGVFTNETTINTSSLSNGMYIVRIIDEDESFSKRFLKK
ncbi:endonuclease [Ascidiimonas sp. W6]|uniref:endonuclease n=1 Tax=Ascidiimonas meishanensis TaxID=3128903 RepID=UPI0030EB93C7